MRKLGAIFWSALAIGFSGAMIPGAMLAMVLSEALGGRIPGALGIVLGHVLLEAALVLALAYGAGRWLRQPIVSAVVGVVRWRDARLHGCQRGGKRAGDPSAMTPSSSAVALPAGPVVARRDRQRAPTRAGSCGGAPSASATSPWRCSGARPGWYRSTSGTRWPTGVWYGAVAALVVGGRSFLQGAGLRLGDRRLRRSAVRLRTVLRQPGRARVRVGCAWELRGGSLRGMIYVGTSGFQYKDWVGPFYPAGPAEDRAGWSSTPSGSTPASSTTRSIACRPRRNWRAWPIGCPTPSASR